jgi:hypothetical protein
LIGPVNFFRDRKLWGEGEISFFLIEGGRVVDLFWKLPERDRLFFEKSFTLSRLFFGK